MSGKSEEKKRERHEAWAKMYKKYLASGKTVREWCEKTGIAEGTFRSRVKQLREEKLEPEHEIVEVRAEAEEQNRHTENKEVIRISGHGITAELPADVSPELVIALMKGMSLC